VDEAESDIVDLATDENELREAQHLCKETYELIKMVQNKEEKNYRGWAADKELTLHNNILYIAEEEKGMLEEDDPVLKAVLPASLRLKAIQEAHGSRLTNHGGSSRTLHRLRRHVFWPRMNKDVTDFVDKCYACQATRNPIPKNKAPLKPIIATDRFQVVSADVLSLPKTRRGNCKLAVFRCLFSGYLNMYPMKGETAEDLALCLEDYISRHGVPCQYHTDGGGGMHNKITTAISKIWGIKKTNAHRITQNRMEAQKEQTESS
jgi:hypothetical protein